MTTTPGIAANAAAAMQAYATLSARCDKASDAIFGLAKRASTLVHATNAVINERALAAHPELREGLEMTITALITMAHEAMQKLPEGINTSAVTPKRKSPGAMRDVTDDLGRIQFKLASLWHRLPAGTQSDNAAAYAAADAALAGARGLVEGLVPYFEAAAVAEGK